ncbi:hypothetical protein QQ045_015470 [Rhodiola kirilowii]
MSSLPIYSSDVQQKHSTLFTYVQSTRLSSLSIKSSRRQISIPPPLVICFCLFFSCGIGIGTCIKRMAIHFKYWNACIEPNDLEDMWNNSQVSTEWLNAGEIRGQKVHLSRDPDGQPYLTQIEMRAVAEIVVSRHFD